VVVDENLAQHAFPAGKDAVGKRIWIPAMGATRRMVGGTLVSGNL